MPNLNTALAGCLGQYVSYCQGHIVSSEMAAADFFRIVRHPFVRAVFFAKDGSFAFITPFITIKRNQTTYGIGVQVVVIRRSAKAGSPLVRFHNITSDTLVGGIRGSFAHPHAAEGQFPCFGQSRADVQKAAEEGRFYDIVHYLSQVWCTYNDRSKLHEIDNWPALSREQLAQLAAEALPRNMEMAETAKVVESLGGALPGDRSVVARLRQELLQTTAGEVPEVSLRSSDIRHAAIFPARRWHVPVYVIGCGGVASHVLRELGKMGIGHSCDITAIDHDMIEAHNPPNQAFDASQIGLTKVEAAATNYSRWSDGAKLHTLRKKVRTTMQISGVVFICIDDMKARKRIVHNLLKNVDEVLLVIETRMDATRARVLTFDPNFHPHLQAWDAEWYSDDDATNAGGCRGHQSVITAVEQTATMAVQQMINWYQSDLHVTRLWNDLAVDLTNWAVWRRRWPTVLDGELEYG